MKKNSKFNPKSNLYTTNNTNNTHITKNSNNINKKNNYKKKNSYQEKEENHRKYIELQKDYKSLEEKVELLNERDEILQKQIQWYKSTNILLKDQVALARLCPDILLITRFHVTRAKKKEKKETEDNEKLRETSAFLQYNPVQYYIFLLVKTVNYDKMIS